MTKQLHAHRNSSYKVGAAMEKMLLAVKGLSAELALVDNYIGGFLHHNANDYGVLLGPMNISPSK
jgi:hypothetical protein